MDRYVTKEIEITRAEKLTKGSEGGMQLTHGKEGIEKNGSER